MTTNEKLIVSATASDMDKIRALVGELEALFPSMEPWEQKHASEDLANGRAMLETGVAVRHLYGGATKNLTPKDLISDLMCEMHASVEGLTCRVNAAGDIGFWRALHPTDHVERAEDFGVRDSKGRTVGGRVKTWTQEHESGDFTYFYCPHALRDGKGFGASQGYQEYKTAAERDAAVEKYFVSARKRASKAAART